MMRYLFPPASNTATVLPLATRTKSTFAPKFAFTPAVSFQAADSTMSYQRVSGSRAAACLGASQNTRRLLLLITLIIEYILYSHVAEVKHVGRIGEPGTVDLP